MTWPAVPLGTLASFAMGQAPPSAETNTDGIGTPFYRSGEFGDVRPTTRIWTTQPLRMGRREDVFICVVGANSGEVNLGDDGAIGRSVAAITPDDRLDQRFLFHLLSSRTDGLRKGAQGSAQGVITKRTLAEISVPLPPIDEQRRVVELLEDHLSSLDAAESYLASVLRRAQVWRQQLLANTLWSADYPLARVGDLLREPMRNGRSDRAATDREAGVRSLTLTAVTKNAFTEANTKVTVTAPGRARDLWLEPGDVFVQRSNTPALVGTTARYDGPREWAIFPDLLIRLRADEDRIDGRFLAAALQSKPGHDQLRRKAKGLAGSMPKIDQAAIADTTIPLPPVEVQQQMLATIESAAEVLALLRAELTSAQRRSRVLRRALFDAAFAGRLTGAASDLSKAEGMIGT